MKTNISEQLLPQAWETLCRSQRELQSLISQKLQQHRQRSYRYLDNTGRPAAVLIPLFFKDGQAYLLFTKRTENMEHHKGQISFPGGSYDAADSDLSVTALRETEEEVGIRVADITLLGQTDKLLTTSGFLITPFVGIFTYPYKFKVNPGEIERLIEVPLIELLDETIFTLKPFSAAGNTWLVHYYGVGEDVIWGVTGFLLSNFLSIVFGLNRTVISEQDLEKKS